MRPIFVQYLPISANSRVYAPLVRIHDRDRQKVQKLKETTQDARNRCTKKKNNPY